MTMMSSNQTKKESENLVLQHERYLRDPFDMTLKGRRLKDRTDR